MRAERSLFDFGPSAREYDQWYDTPAGQAHDRAQKDDVRRFLRPATVGEALLDVGCGTGHWTVFFAEMGYRVTGIDVAREAIEVARSAAPDCTFQVADARDLPFEDASFDVVASMAALEFFPDPTMAVEEMVRCAKPGGTLLIGTLNWLAPLNRQRASKGKQPYASARMFTPVELRRVLAPWGRVRMVASAPRGQVQGAPARGSILRWFDLGRRNPKGPCIVAAVRL